MAPPVVRAPITVVADDVLPDLLALLEAGLLSNDVQGRFTRPRAVAAVEAFRVAVSGLMNEGEPGEAVEDDAGVDILFWTVDDVARRAHLSRERVRRLCRDGRLRSHKDGRSHQIDRDSAEAFLAARKRAAA